MNGVTKDIAYIQKDVAEIKGTIKEIKEYLPELLKDFRKGMEKDFASKDFERKTAQELIYIRKLNKVIVGIGVTIIIAVIGSILKLVVK